MKLVITERVKHRLIGVLVALSLAVIFLPAVMKRSNQRFDENMRLSLKLPAQPKLPQVAIPNQKTMFKTVKVAHVDIPAAPTVRAASIIAKAEPLHTKREEQMRAKPVSVLASLPKAAPATVALKAPIINLKKAAAISTAVQKPILKKGVFSIQVAAFSQKSNAETLVHRLKQKGYLASYNKVKRGQAELYQVVVGEVNQREQAIDLQKKLAVNMQLNGLIVKMG